MRYCLALDLKNDPSLIAEYERYHAPGGVWQAVLQSIRDSGIEVLEIYRTSNRMSMIIEANEHFSFEKKAAADAANPQVQAWEELMWTLQQALPHAAAGEKWMLMERIFSLVEHSTND